MVFPASRLAVAALVTGLRPAQNPTAKLRPEPSALAFWAAADCGIEVDELAATKACTALAHGCLARLATL